MTETGPLTKGASFLHNKSMFEKRKDPRFHTLAHARIAGVMEGENLLKDLSITGCCVECTTLMDIKSGIPFELEIMPEHASGIGSFTLSVESKWTRSLGYSNDIGFAVIASPKGKLFQRYVDYLSWKQAHPSSMP